MEAVNTSITSAQFARSGVAAASRGGAVTNAGGGAAGNAGGAAPGGIDVPFTTLNVTVNSRFDEAVLQFRDPQTGDVEQQIPSVDELESRQRLQRATADENAAAQTSQRSDDSREQSIRVRPGNSNNSAQVQLNQNSGGSSSASESRNADSGVAGQAIAALQAASAGDGNSGGNGAQSAQVSVLA